MIQTLAVVVVSVAAQALTGSAVRVPGSAVSMIPPRGFEKTDRFPGFICLEEGSSIMVTELPAPYAKTMAGFSKRGLQSRGMTLLKREELTISGQEGMLLHLSQSARGTQFLKWITVVGDSRSTTMVTATFPQTMKKALSEKLRTSVLSVRIGAGRPAVDLEGLIFGIEPAGKLKIARRVGSNLLFSKDGIFPPRSPTEPILTIGPSMSKDMAIPDKKDFSVQRVKAVTALRNVAVTEVTPITIDGLRGYEILATADDKKSGTKLIVYQVTLFEKTDYFMMLGLAPGSEKKTYVSVFRATTKTFKRKAADHTQAPKRVIK